MKEKNSKLVAKLLELAAAWERLKVEQKPAVGW